MTKKYAGVFEIIIKTKRSIFIDLLVYFIIYYLGTCKNMKSIASRVS